jgi:heat shock protein HslJ/uncharacterized lipoprotein YbaY
VIEARRVLIARLVHDDPRRLSMKSAVPAVTVGLLLSLALAGCDSGREAGEPLGAAAGTFTIAGELTYKPRIALPPDSRAVIELRGSAPPDVVVAERFIELAGRQVPIPFELGVDRSDLENSQTYTFHAAIYSEGLPIWINAGDVVQATDVDLDLGRVMLQPFDTKVKATNWRCEDQAVSVDFAGEAARLRAGSDTFALRRVVTASGAKYEALGDSSTYVWNKGDELTVAVRGRDYPSCRPAEESSAAFRGSGNEPGWTIEIGPDEITLVTRYGESKLTVATPPVDVDAGALRYVAPTDEGLLEVTITDGPCHDSMSGMPHPKHVTVSHAGETLRGCGGEPRELLLGNEWVVDRVAGQAVIDDTQITLRFNDDGSLGGSGSCNSYTASYTLTGEGLTISQPAVTMKACPPEVMAQEDRFLKSLAEMHRFEIGENGALLLHTPDGRTIEARRG